MTKDNRASQIAEAALVLPIAFMMLLGIYWFGRAFNIYATINHAARLAARVGVAQTCATCSPGNAYQLPSVGVQIITDALQASGIDPSQIQQYNPSVPTYCSTSGACTGNPAANNNITFCTNVRLTPAASPYTPVCGVTVTFQYPYQMWLPFTSLNLQQIILKADVQMQGEY